MVAGTWHFAMNGTIEVSWDLELAPSCGDSSHESDQAAFDYKTCSIELDRRDAQCFVDRASLLFRRGEEPI
jgi:hypothetical protein